MELFSCSYIFFIIIIIIILFKTLGFVSDQKESTEV